MDKKTVGRKIRIYRERAKLSQKDVAKAMGYSSASSITLIEQGITDMPADKLRKLANVLGVDASIFMVNNKKDYTEYENYLPYIAKTSKEHPEYLVAIKKLLGME